MTDFKFKAEKRDEKVKETRKAGLIPAILYGKNFDNVNLSLNKFDFAKLYKEAGSSNLIDLSFDDQNIKTLIHDVQIDPIKENIVHVDFYKVDMKQKITTEVPLEFVGETVLVVEQEGSFIASKDSLEVECLPTDLVDHIDVDISHLTDFEQNIKVSDIKIPAGIEILNDPEEIVALVQPPRSEEELAELEKEVVEDVEAVEVEHKGEEAAEGAEKAEGEEGKAAEGAEGTEKSTEANKSTEDNK